jgi:hypothetical protein
MRSPPEPLHDDVVTSWRNLCSRQVPIFRDDDVERDALYAVLTQVRMPALRERVEAVR